MKLRRRVFIALGWFSLLFQIFGYMGSLNDPEPVFQNVSIAFMLGYNFLVMLAILFFILANRLKRKIKQKELDQEIDSFLVDNNSNLHQH